MPAEFSEAFAQRFFYAVLFFLGLCVGSFLNVVIARLPHDQSVVRPRSRCPRCSRFLPWFENIPVFSWLFLRGRCRGCREPISLRYPAVELLTGLLFLACGLRFGFEWSAVRALVLIGLLVPLSFIDLEHWILPFSLTLPGIVLGPLSALPLGWDVLRDALLGAGLGFVSFWALEWVGKKIFNKEALGEGDKYLLALLGGFLGWQTLLGVVFLSSLQASVVGISLLLLRGRAGPAPAEVPQHQPGEEDWVPGPTNLPLGPWLSLAGIEILLLTPIFSHWLPWPMSALVGAWG